MNNNSTHDRPIGEQICCWRQLRGWSQRELARRANIANGALSQVELGHSSPAVNTLQKVASALGISLQALMFDEPCLPYRVMRKHEAIIDEEVVLGRSTVFYSHANATDKFSFCNVHLSGGQTLTSASLFSMQRQKFNQDTGFTVYVYEGRCCSLIAGMTNTLNAGDALWIVAGASFELQADSTMSAVIWPM